MTRSENLRRVRIEWRVELADKTARPIEARGFRVESGGLVFVRPAGCVAAYAPGTWLTVEGEQP